MNEELAGSHRVFDVSYGAPCEHPDYVCPAIMPAVRNSTAEYTGFAY